MRHILVRILSIVVVYALINGVVVGVQWLFQAGERAQLEETVATMAQQEGELTVIAEEVVACLTWLDAESTRLTAAEDTLEQLSAAYVAGAPGSAGDAFNRNRDNFNRDVAVYDTEWERCGALYAGYEARIDAYDALVAESNRLNEKVGRMWYILPIPGRGGVR